MKKLLEELFSRYYRDVYRYLYSITRDAALSEDLASEVFVEVVRSLPSFRGESDVKTWMFSIARHRWYAYLRRKQRSVPETELAENLTNAERSLEEQLQNAQTARRIMELLDSGPERTRMIVLLRTEGYSFHEIGERTGVSENSARVIDFRARAKIRQILKKEGFVDV